MNSRQLSRYWMCSGSSIASAANARWASVLIIVVSACVLIVGLSRARAAAPLSRWQDRLLVWWPMGLLAGWLTIASALNILTVLTAEDLRIGGTSASEAHDSTHTVVKIPPQGIPLEEIERQAVVEALKMANWVQKDAAELQGRTENNRVVNFDAGSNASALIGQMTAAADRDGVECWLENTNPRNASLYRRMGFEAVETFTPAPGAPPISTMRRPRAR